MDRTRQVMKVKTGLNRLRLGFVNNTSGKLYYNEHTYFRNILPLIFRITLWVLRSIYYKYGSINVKQ